MTPTGRQPVRRQTRMEEACARITAMALRLGPNAKLPTVLELRDELRVSLRTLNSALGELERREVIYRLHAVGLFVAPGLRRHVALICAPRFFHGANPSPFWQQLIDHATTRARERNETLSLHFALPEPGVGLPARGLGLPAHSVGLLDGLAAEIRAGTVHGALCVGLARKTLAWMSEQGIPHVCFASVVLPGACGVAVGGLDVIPPAVRALARQGARRVGLWANGVSADMRPAVARAFSEAMEAAGLPVHPGLIRIEEADSSQAGLEQGYRMASATFDSQDPPDGLVIGDDMLTCGALPLFRERGIRPGRELLIATHANRGSPLLWGYEDQLTRVEVDPGRLVSTMLDMLDSLLAGHMPDPPLVRIMPVVEERIEERG